MCCNVGLQIICLHVVQNCVSVEFHPLESVSQDDVVMHRTAPAFRHLTVTHAVLRYFCQKLLVCGEQIQDISLAGFHQDDGLVVGGGGGGVDHVGQTLHLPGPAVLPRTDSSGEIPEKQIMTRVIRKINANYLKADNFSIFTFKFGLL